MENHPIDNLMRSTLENIKNMVDVNTIVGDAVESKDGSTIIPISKVSFGFASGGSEFAPKQNNTASVDYPFGGGAGAGVTIKPVAFLVLKNQNIRLLSCDQETTIDRIVDSVPQVIEIIKDFGKPKASTEENQTPPIQ